MCYNLHLKDIRLVVAFKVEHVCFIQMQLRFDGFFGFPGGFVDDTDGSVVDGLNRELVEELNLDIEKHRVTQSDHVMSCVCPHRKFVTHFYAIEVTRTQFEDIEKRSLLAHDWGGEVRLFDNMNSALSLYVCVLIQ